MGRFSIAAVVEPMPDGLPDKVIGYVVLELVGPSKHIVSRLFRTFDEALALFNLLKDLTDDDDGGGEPSPQNDATAEVKVAALWEVDLQTGERLRADPDGYCLVTMTDPPVVDTRRIFRTVRAAQAAVRRIMNSRGPRPREPDSPSTPRPK